MQVTQRCHLIPLIGSFINYSGQMWCVDAVDHSGETVVISRVNNWGVRLVNRVPLSILCA